MGIFGFGDDKPAQDVAEARRSALEEAQVMREEAGFAGLATDLVEKLLDVGIDGRGPLDSARQVAEAARRSTGSTEAAVAKVVRKHVAAGAAEGFVTGLGGFVTMAVALPANVVAFYVIATRMVASVAHLRGYDVDDPHIRTAVMLTLVGADADDVLKRAGVVAGVGMSGRLTNLATQRLPGPALMVVNKAIGFRLAAQAGRATLGRLGKAVPVVGGAVGAGLESYLLKRIADHARQEFPQRTP